MLTVHQKELLDYFDLCIDRFPAWIQSNQTQIIHTDIFADIQGFLDTELHKNLEKYHKKTVEYQKTLDIIIELHTMSKDSGVFQEMLKHFTYKI